MPTYEFQCTGCSKSFSQAFPFGSNDLPSCPKCGKATRKVIHPPTLHFKGSGFYKTDNSTKKAEAKTTNAPAASKPSAVPAAPPAKP